MAIHWIDPAKLLDTAKSKFLPTNIILDICCGIHPQEYQKALVHICAEPFDQYVDKLQEKIALRDDRQFVIIRAGWEEIVKLMPPKSVDTVYLLDIIEHLPKALGRRLLKKTEQIARKQVITFMPIGFMPEDFPGKDAWGFDGGQRQTHRSGWELKDFDKTWEIYASKKFHHAQDYETSKKMFGAFFAVKTMPGATEDKVQNKLWLVWNTIVLSPVLSEICLFPLNMAIKLSRLIRQIKKKLKG
ncbi:MAG: class I SAM-dependent methyltransferase [Candidatus Berkelbacteria bacterium]